MSTMHTPRLLTTIEAAKVLRLSPRTLERLRVQGTGPSYMKAGRGLRARVLYTIEDLNAWIARKYASTSEYSTGVSAAHAKTA